MACSKEFKLEPASIATQRFNSKDNKPLYYVENGFSSLHPGHPGQTFFYDGEPFKCVRAALLFAKAKAMGDGQAMEIAKRLSHSPSRLREVVMVSNKPNGGAEWTNMVNDVVDTVTQAYLDSNPKAVAELLTTNKSKIIIRGEEPQQTCLTSFQVADCDNLTDQLKGINLIGKTMVKLRTEYEIEEREKQPSFYYDLVKNSERDIIDEVESDRIKRLHMFSIEFNVSAIRLDPIMQKRIIADALDVLLGQLNQKVSVRLTVAEGDNLIVTEEWRQPRDISRGVLSQTVVGSTSFGQLVEGGLAIQTEQYMLASDNDDRRKRSSSGKSDPLVKKTKIVKKGKVNVDQD